jgi:hypothetical protein
MGDGLKDSKYLLTIENRDITMWLDLAWYMVDLKTTNLA